MESSEMSLHFPFRVYWRVWHLWHDSEGGVVTSLVYRMLKEWHFSRQFHTIKGHAGNFSLYTLLPTWYDKVWNVQIDNSLSAGWRISRGLSAAPSWRHFSPPVETDEWGESVKTSYPRDWLDSVCRLIKVTINEDAAPQLVLDNSLEQGMMGWAK